jgi:antitoxin MazE
VIEVALVRWGNSLGLRIPKDIATRLDLREGERVDIETDGDRIVIVPGRQRYALSDLLQGMNPAGNARGVRLGTGPGPRGFGIAV